VKLPALTAFLLLPLCVLACDDEPASNGVRSPEATAHQTSTPSDAVPSAPAEFDAYPQAVADYLTAHPQEGGGLACLHGLFNAWNMPYLSGERSCRAGNSDEDADGEVAVVLAVHDAPECGVIRYRVALLDPSGDAFRVAYVSPVAAMACDAANMLGNVIIAIEDLNREGGGELAYAEQWCGAHTCGVTVHIVSGAGASYRALTPDEGYAMETPRRVEFFDEDGDGVKELLLSGGAIQSAGSGPGVLRTDTYAWNGTQYALLSSVPD
jgi:hypothetical protein